MGVINQPLTLASGTTCRRRDARSQSDGMIKASQHVDDLIPELRGLGVVSSEMQIWSEAHTRHPMLRGVLLLRPLIGHFRAHFPAKLRVANTLVMHKRPLITHPTQWLREIKARASQLFTFSPRIKMIWNRIKIAAHVMNIDWAT